jgi:hypothetical protein
MAIMYLPECSKALGHLYRVTRPDGKCFITTWHRTETREMGERVLRRLRGCNDWVDIQFWKAEMENPGYLISVMEKAGFRDCGAEQVLVYATYPGHQGLDLAMELAPVLLSKYVDFRDDKERQLYKQLWREEFKSRQMEGELKVKMWANIVWGTK